MNDLNDKNKQNLIRGGLTMKYKTIITLSIGIPILLGGCMNLDTGNHDKNGEKQCLIAMRKLTKI